MDISAMDPKDIPGLFDAEVVGPDGEKVGTIQQIFADEVTGAATFVTVLSQGHEYFIPVRGAEYSTSQVNVPFSRNLIETAPEASEEDDLSRALFEAVLHGTGVLIPTWRYHEERVRRLESWTGFDGRREETLADLIAFEATYPNWRDEPALVTLHRQLAAGQDVEREITVTLPVVNHPDFQHIELKQVRVYPTVNGTEGLQTTPLYGYETTYTRFQLDALAQQDVLDTDALGRLLPQAREDADDAQAQVEEFVIFQGTMRYQHPGDDVPTRYQVWFAVEEAVVLRVRAYPWWFHEADLIPFYVRQ